MAADRYGRKEAEFCDDMARRYDAPYRLEQRGLADIAGGIGVPAGGVQVAQRNRLHCGRGVDGGLEESGMKSLEAAPECGDPFREHRDQRPAPEFRGNCLSSVPGGRALAALDVKRADQGAQPADDRPSAYLRLGDKGGREYRVDDENINPGNVI